MLSLFLASAGILFLCASSMKFRDSLKRFAKGVSDPLLSNSGLPVRDSRKSSSSESFPPWTEAFETARDRISVAGAVAGPVAGACSLVTLAGREEVAGTIVLRRLALLACSARSLVLGIWPPPASLFLDLERPRAREAGLK